MDNIKPVYFQNLTVNSKVVEEVPPTPGWHNARDLRLIHAMRYKPESRDGSDEKLSFQPEILNEHSNERLAQIANGEWNTSAVFVHGKIPIISGCLLASRNSNLLKVEILPAPLTKWNKWTDCLSIFYKSNRAVRHGATFAEMGAVHDAADPTRGEGYPSNCRLDLLNSAAVFSTLDYAALGEWDRVRKGESVETIASDALAMLKNRLKEISLLIDINIKPAGEANILMVNKKPLADAHYSIQDTITITLDLFARLCKNRRFSLDNPVIVLIENARSLVPEILTQLFPRAQFITN